MDYENLISEQNGSKIWPFEYNETESRNVNYDV